MIPSLLRQRLHGLYWACVTLPSQRAWWHCAGLFGAFVVIALPLGFWFEFLRFDPMRQGAIGWVTLALTLFVVPCLPEELVFRGLLLPHPREKASLPNLRRSILLSLLAFVLWHPLNGWVISPAAQSVLTNPVFLILVIFLGVTTTLAYIISGSIWPSVIIHWLTVSGWVLLFGG